MEKKKNKTAFSTKGLKHWRSTSGKIIYLNKDHSLHRNNNNNSKRLMPAHPVATRTAVFRAFDPTAEHC